MLDLLLIKHVPKFKQHWEQDDICKENNGDFTPHAIMDSFLMFFQHNSASLTTLQISTLCTEFEEIVASDYDNSNSNANAICSMFLELLVDSPVGSKIEPFLGPKCKEFWNCYKS